MPPGVQVTRPVSTTTPPPGPEAGGGNGGGQITAPGPKKEEKEENVSVPKSLLEKLVSTVEKQTEQISILTEAADKNKLSEVERRRNSGKLVKSVRISSFRGKIIVGWRRTKDEVYFDAEGRLVEKQEIELVFEDKSKEVVTMRQFSNEISALKAEVLRESRDNEGNIFYVVAFEDGKELEISQTFIN